MSSTTLKTVTWVIGTDRTCDVIVQGAGLSPRHCRLIQDESRWFVEAIDGQVHVDCAVVHSRIRIEPRTSVALSASHPLPWPSETGSTVFTIGRAADCDIVLDSPGVSGRHARLIIGPQRTMVLADWPSKNGIRSDAESSIRVKAISLSGLSVIYFGTSPFSVQSLLERAESLHTSRTTLTTPSTDLAAYSVKNASQERFGTKKRTPPSWQAILSQFLLPMLVPTIVLTLLYALGWLPFLDANGSPDIAVNQPTQIEKSNGFALPEQSQTASAGNPVVSIDNRPTELPPILPPTSTGPALNESAKRTQPSGSVYWVVIQHRENKQWFRLCSGVAVSPTLILTVGSLAETGHEMTTKEYQSLSVVHVASGDRQPVEQHWIHPQLIRRLAVAEAATDAHKHAVDKSEKNIEEIEKATSLLNVSLSAAAAVDGGMLKVANVDQWLEIDREMNLRPQQAVRFCNASFDAKDPFCDPDEMRRVSGDSAVPAPVPDVAGRVQMLSQSIEGVSGQTIIAVESAPQGANWFGCPCITQADKLIGVVVYADFGPILKLETLSPQTIAELYDVASSN